jgi:tetratricopeptide (TPR) repeat protein
MCYEGLSDEQQAEENYLAALNADPRNIGLLRVLISFYLRNNELDKADARVDQLLDPAAGNPPDVVEDARRTRAIITASRGGYEALSRALQMLKTTGEKLMEVSAADLRAQAAILGRSPLRRDQIRLAGVLEEIARREELTVLGQLQLARLYEAIGRRPDAVALYRKLKDSDPDNGAIVFEFITGALNQKHPDAETLDDVSDAVTRLQHKEPDSFRTATARARLLAAKDQAGQAGEVLKAYLERLPGLTSDELVRDLAQQQKPGESTVMLMALAEKKEGEKARAILEEARKLRKAGNEAEALEALQRYLAETDYAGALQGELIRIAASFFESISDWDAAEAAYRNYVLRSPLAEAVLVRASFLARRNRIDEALDLCEAAAQDCPPYSVAQVSVGVVRVGKPSREQISRVEERLMSAINKAEPTLAAALSISLADLRDSQERYADAKAIYRRLLEQNDRNIVALNNLAWLVSFEPIERETALGLINQAIKLVGPVPDLLDTRAVIRLNLDRPREAIADLEDALKEVARAGIWYHLAVAQLKIGDKVAAADSFRKAEEAGFDPKSLHSLERSSYQQLLKQMPADARRAQR